MNEGASWSGRERNNAFLNLGDGRFVHAAAVLGLDFSDDGRLVCVTDWDHDGDLDLWLRNRTGPQLRLMRNDLPAGSWVAFELKARGKNTDAIGARVILTAGGRRHVRSVISSDGYLAQSSRRIHFGLNEANSIDRMEVVWPDGSRALITPPGLNRIYRLVQGARKVVPHPASQESLPTGPVKAVPPPSSERVLLRAPLPLPPGLLADLPERKPGRMTIVNLWSVTCVPCFEELGEWSSRREDLDRAGIDVTTICVDDEAARNQAGERYKTTVGDAFPWRLVTPKLNDRLLAVTQHVRILVQDGWTLPASLLVDDQGNLQAVYAGRTETDALIRDRKLLVGLKPHLRGPKGGRWCFRMPRDLDGLARTLEALGLEGDAAFYRKRKQ